MAPKEVWTEPDEEGCQYNRATGEGRWCGGESETPMTGVYHEDCSRQKGAEISVEAENDEDPSEKYRGWSRYFRI